MLPWRPDLACSARGGGSLLFTGSASGLQGSVFGPVYPEVKFGVVGFVRSLAKRLAPEGVRMNTVCPGSVDTPMPRVFVARPDQASARGNDVEALVQERAGADPAGPRRLDTVGAAVEAGGEAQ